MIFQITVSWIHSWLLDFLEVELSKQYDRTNDKGSYNRKY